MKQTAAEGSKTRLQRVERTFIELEQLKGTSSAPALLFCEPIVSITLVL